MSHARHILKTGSELRRRTSPCLCSELRNAREQSESGCRDGNAESGIESWSIPGVVPRNVEITVYAEHHDVGVDCTATLVVKLEGGFFDSPVGPIAVAGTAISGLLVGFSAVRRRFVP